MYIHTRNLPAVCIVIPGNLPAVCIFIQGNQSAVCIFIPGNLPAVCIFIPGNLPAVCIHTENLHACRFDCEAILMNNAYIQFVHSQFFGPDCVSLSNSKTYQIVKSSI